MRLRIDDRGFLKLTCPPSTSRKSALGWAIKQREWIAGQLARRLPGEPFLPGCSIPLGGVEVQLDWVECAPRAGRLEGSTLVVGGPREGFERRVEQWLRGYARDLLSAEVTEISKLASVSPTGVSIGDASTRWGSCSSRGRIRLSWRLICASPEARRYVVAHEVAHLRHLNHGSDFHALEAVLVGPDLAFAKACLRSEGPRLRRLGRR